MDSLIQKISFIVGQAFEDAGLPKELGLVRVSDRPDLAQFQCNGAMAAAIIAKKAPREIAKTVIENLRDSMALSKIEIAGPGFINIDIMDETLSDHLNAVSESKTLGIAPVHGKPVMVLDYGGPNIAKPMHVGHLRASIIGDSLRRIANFAGYKTYGDVHLGDWGTHLGMLFSDYERDQKTNWVVGIDLKDKAQKQALFDDMSERYPIASASCKSDKAKMAQALRITKALQDGEQPYKKMWEIIREVSVYGMKENFDALNVHFDLWNGEASVHHLIPDMIKGLEEKNLAHESNGATIMPVKRNSDNKEFPPIILYKSDGAVMYGTTDMATILERMNELKPDKIVYVVDQRQSLHFEQVFRAVRMADIAPIDKVELTFAGFGTMNGTDGKPFKTRAGGVMKLEDLISTGINKARERLKEANIGHDLNEEEQSDIAQKIAVAAIKFADLQNNRISDYVFDIDRFMSFEGKTGPYLLYQAVRIKSLLHKAEKQNIKPAKNLTIAQTDRSLALLLAQFPESFKISLENYTPHILCDYVFKLAQEFSSFYGNCHILSEENEQLRASRLALCALTYRYIEQILDLFGIQIPEKM